MTMQYLRHCPREIERRDAISPPIASTVGGGEGRRGRWENLVVFGCDVMAIKVAQLDQLGSKSRCVFRRQPSIP